ncbi:MAG: SMP-30/gluconolactonase/LRE family protein [Myxococcota bacterium]
MLRTTARILGVTALFLGLYLWLWPVPIRPVSWSAHPLPPLEGEFEPNQILQDLELYPTPDAHGPEDVAVDSEGRVYVGVEQGQILRYSPDGQQVEVFAVTDGRPLGLDFDVNGNLIIADAVKGLLSASPNGEITVLCTEAGYHSFGFTDDVDVDSQNVAWFSDASYKWGHHDVMNEVFESAPNGRLVKYDISTGECKVVASDLHFANGVAVSPDETYVLVNETMRYGVKRIYVRGPDAGRVEVFRSNLPGFPDGISTSPAGTFWLALYSPRNALLDSASERPWLRKVIYRIPSPLQPKPRRHPFVMEFDAEGNVLRTVQDEKGQSFAMSTSAEQVGDWLYVGSLSEPHWGRIDLTTLP